MNLKMRVIQPLDSLDVGKPRGFCSSRGDMIRRNVNEIFACNVYLNNRFTQYFLLNLK